jgi:hypothetical protein
VIRLFAYVEWGRIEEALVDIEELNRLKEQDQLASCNGRASARFMKEQAVWDNEKLEKAQALFKGRRLEVFCCVYAKSLR